MQAPTGVASQIAAADASTSPYFRSIGKRAESQPRRLAIKSRGGAQRIGVEAEPEQRRELIREAPRREGAERREGAAAAPLVPVAVAEAALPRAYEPAKEHERATGFAERERELAGAGAPKVGEKLETATHGMREGLEERPRREGALQQEQRQGGAAYGTEARREELPGYEARGTGMEGRDNEGRTHAGEAGGVQVSTPQALAEGRREGREGAYEARGAGAGTYGARAAELPRERIGGEHIGVRATRADEIGGREAGYEGREGREGGVARVMYTTRAEGGAKGREAEGREAYGEEEHHRGIMGKVSDTMHRVGAKLRGEE